MGISAGGSKNGPKSDMNVTPLVDVVLVMLIIFLLAMPIQIRKIEIQVPQELKEDVVSISEALTVTVLGKTDGTMIINDGTGDISITRVKLKETMEGIFEKAKDKEKVVFVDFEDTSSYSDVISAMDTIRGAAPKKTVVNPDDGKSKQVADVKLAMTIRDEDRQK